MSRFLLTCSLVFAFSSVAFAERAEANFATPPTAAAAEAFDPPMGLSGRANTRVAPHRVLDRAKVRAALVRARATNLAAFRSYQLKGMYPNNTFKGQKLNVWIDEDGNLCAAATIIHASGQSDLVFKIAEQNNFIKLADVKQGPLMSWILTSGLTQDEIAAIQEPFMPVTDRPVMEPAQPILVDNKLRNAEDARLRVKYRAVDKMIVKNHKKSLDLAVDRLMKNQDLAWQLIAAK